MARRSRPYIALAISMVVMCLVAFGQTSERDVASGTVFSVLIYNSAHVPGDVLATALQEASRVYLHAGLRARWLNCSQADPQPVCGQAATPETLVVSVLPKAAGLSKSEIFGVSYLSREGNGTYGSVFYDRIQDMNTRRPSSLASLLGHVIAHELGHLLLGSNAHTHKGIMCAHWEARELRQLEMGGLFFTVDQAAMLRTRVAMRIEPSLSDPESENAIAAKLRQN